MAKNISTLNKVSMSNYKVLYLFKVYDERHGVTSLTLSLLGVTRK